MKLYTIVQGDGGGVRTRTDPSEVIIDVRRGEEDQGRTLVARIIISTQRDAIGMHVNYGADVGFSASPMSPMEDTDYPRPRKS